MKSRPTARVAADNYEGHIRISDHARCTFIFTTCRMMALLVPISLIAVSITSSSPTVATLW